MLIERYSDAAKPEWDRFVTASKNGHFQFQRAYMDYHRDRFPDFSWIVRDDQGHPVALLPAHRSGAFMSSHAGLTQGGFLTDSSMKLPRMLRIFDEVLTRLQEEGVETLLYKTIPHTYHAVPAEEDRYALFLLGARWVRSGMLAVVDREQRPAYQERRRRAIKKALGRHLQILQIPKLAEYWAMLTKLLAEVHNTRPVHTLEEMQSLHVAFPGEIQLHGCFEDSRMLAGVLIYESPRVARAQYIASTDEGRAAGALDLLFDHLLTVRYADKRYFDFGTSEEAGGCQINEGLVGQKEGFGARAVAMDHYEINLNRWNPGSLTRALT